MGGRDLGKLFSLLELCENLSGSGPFGMSMESLAILLASACSLLNFHYPRVQGPWPFGRMWPYSGLTIRTI